MPLKTAEIIERKILLEEYDGFKLLCTIISIYPHLLNNPKTLSDLGLIKQTSEETVEGASGEITPLTFVRHSLDPDLGLDPISINDRIITLSPSEKKKFSNEIKQVSDRFNISDINFGFKLRYYCLILILHELHQPTITVFIQKKEV